MSEVKRISREAMFKSIVTILSERSTCTRRQVGALLIRDNRIIAMGYNGSPSGLPHCEDVGCLIGPDGGCIRTVHAEANVIAFAAKEGIETKGATLYVTLEPCLTCAKLIINAGITHVMCLEKYDRSWDGVLLLESAGVKVTYV